MSKRAKKPAANENISVAGGKVDGPITTAFKLAQAGQAVGEFAQGTPKDKPLLQGSGETFPDYCARVSREHLEGLDAKLAILRRHKVAKYSEHGLSIEFDRAAFVEPRGPREESTERDPHFDPEDEETED